MASTSSSSSHLIPISSSPSWKYDVFLSFRGEDTRKIFVDHLYSALVQHGIHTYKDDKTLPRGDFIGSSLFRAICESRIAVVILSENYADSSWCLDELAHIIKCMDETRQIVLPVFYGVEPSDVRKQEGKYGDAFVKYEMENNNKVELWRKALTNVGNLSGWVPKDIANGHEAQCIKEIVLTISSSLSLLISNVNEGLIGIETRFYDLESMLEIQTGGVRMVGIWGIGGGGKTTLASFVYTKISHQFEGSCLLENVREKLSKQSFEELQNKVLSLVLKTTLPQFGSVEEGKWMIKSRLCRRKVLIVLDDVDDSAQLEALAGSHDWFGEGSRLIITTRDENLVTCKVDAIYAVSLLSHNEARELFRRHAYREGKHIEDYGSLSRDVISYCDGLPLALKILGSFLYDKDKDEWISTLAKLMDVPNSKVMDKLRISYDGIEPNEKELFLDIAYLFIEEDVDVAMPILDAFGFHPVIGLKVLAQKSLVTVSNGMFHMHDLVKEMAYYIIRGGQTRHPEEHTRVWRKEDVEKLCALGTTKENHKIEALVIGDEFSNLPQVVANMKTLRFLYWVYSKSPFPKAFQPEKLVCLMLIGGSQEQLWKGCKHLPNLKILDLSGSMLIRTPDFKGLPCLEQLILRGCKGLKELHPSMGHLERLVLLDMQKCKSLERFPPIIQMGKLETLNLSDCISLKKFPEIRASMDKLVELRLERSAIEIIPSSFGKYCTNLECVNLDWCVYLKRIEGDFQLLKRLKYLYLRRCVRLEKLAEDFFGVECCLEVLDLSASTEEEYYDEEASASSMNCFLDCFGFSHQDSISMRFPYRDSFSMRFPQFPRLLKKLNLRSCMFADGDIPSGIFDELLNLQILHLRNNNFSQLPSLSRLQSLKWLNLDFCNALVQLPDLPTSIAILHARCSSLEQVGDLSICKCLWKFSFQGCDKLGGWESVTRYLLQESVVINSFMSMTVPFHYHFEYEENKDEEGRKYRLQLPEKWYNNFSGFLLCLTSQFYTCTITIKHEEKEETCMVESQPDEWMELDKNIKNDGKYGQVGYIPFASLTHTSWWNTSSKALSFYLRSDDNHTANIRVGLVPKSKGDLIEIPKAAIECSRNWEGEKGFSINEDSKLSIVIEWYHFDHALGIAPRVV